MAGKRKYGRPNRFDVLGMMIINALNASIILLIVFGIFGTRTIFLPITANIFTKTGIEGHLFKWLCYAMLLPGAGIMYGCLWFWLTLVGRRKGINWGAACVYGVGVALANVLFCGFLVGLLLSNALVGLIFALINILMSPHLLMATASFGLIMGLLNGLWASNWIVKHKPQD